jgi:hypothetical protein
MAESRLLVKIKPNSFTLITKNWLRGAKVLQLGIYASSPYPFIKDDSNPAYQACCLLGLRLPLIIFVSWMFQTAEMFQGKLRVQLTQPITTRSPNVPHCSVFVFFLL